MAFHRLLRNWTHARERGKVVHCTVGYFPDKNRFTNRRIHYCGILYREKVGYSYHQSSLQQCVYGWRPVILREAIHGAEARGHVCVVGGSTPGLGS